MLLIAFREGFISSVGASFKAKYMYTSSDTQQHWSTDHSKMEPNNLWKSWEPMELYGHVTLHFLFPLHQAEHYSP